MEQDPVFSVSCPCCGAILKVDGEHGVVVSHEVPEDETAKTSFEERMSALEAEKRAAEDKFQESIRAEKSKKDVLEKKFQDLFEKAKKAPAGPVKRSIDLD